jgi:septal ring factor EnvC (AmiA/AmiB activator)
MNNLANASINTFGPSPKAGFESPSELLITMTYGQLQDLIVQAVQEGIQPLQDEIAQLREERDQDHQEIASLHAKLASLESLQEQDTTRIYTDIAYDRQRLAKLENSPIKEPGRTETNRAEKIDKYLASRPDHRATFESLRGHLGVDKDRLNEAIKTLMASSPGRYGIVRAPGDKRKRILVMLPK